MEENKHAHAAASSHFHGDASIPPIRIAVVTISDSRTPETDQNGQYLTQQIKDAGWELAAYHIVRDEPAEIEQVLQALQGSTVQVILFNGGTGFAKRDSTHDVLAGRLEKVLPGFGELFRVLSYEQVGAPAMFSRAIAGSYRGKMIFSTPGSPAAVQLAWEKLIAPDLDHLIWEMTK